MRLVDKARRAATLNASDWELLQRAFVAVARIRITLWILPWRRLTASHGTRAELSHHSVAPQHLEWAVKAVSRVVPYATCLTQALALHRLLSRYGHSSTVQVGVRNADGQFSAHAWVEQDGVLLLGTSADVAGYSRFFTWPQPGLDH